MKYLFLTVLFMTMSAFAQMEDMNFGTFEPDSKPRQSALESKEYSDWPDSNKLDAQKQEDTVYEFETKDGPNNINKALDIQSSKKVLR